MNFENFNSIVIEHRNSMIIIGCIVFSLLLAGALFVEFYVRERLDFKYLPLGKFRISPTWFVIVLIAINIIYSLIAVKNCNEDIASGSYETYIGNCSYKERTVTLQELNLKVRVSGGHDIVPHGDSYGKCIYAKDSKVIVYWEELTPE